MLLAGAGLLLFGSKRLAAEHISRTRRNRLSAAAGALEEACLKTWAEAPDPAAA